MIPLLIETALGRRAVFSLFGNDFPTKDGTCVRDFIHVVDLASAHHLALDYLSQRGDTTAFNVGTGHGYSVKEVVDIFKYVTSTDFTVNIKDKRAGDPARLVASSTKLMDQCQWKPLYSDIETIIKHAWCAQKNIWMK